MSAEHALTRARPIFHPAVIEPRNGVPAVIEGPRHEPPLPAKPEGDGWRLAAAVVTRQGDYVWYWERPRP